MHFAHPRTKCVRRDRNSNNTEARRRRDSMRSQTASPHRDVFIFLNVLSREFTRAGSLCASASLRSVQFSEHRNCIHHGGTETRRAARCDTRRNILFE